MTNPEIKRTVQRQVWVCRDHVFQIPERILIMGILNVTPDSFSDGGRYMDADKAVERGLIMVEEGADILDIGGESTRPGAEEVPAQIEIERVIPVIEKLKRKTNAVISIDTMKSEVAARALEAGASIINDVSALTHDPKMAAVAGKAGAGVVLMHRQGDSRTMQVNPGYDNVTAEVSSYLGKRVRELEASGLKRETMVVDPGIGFGKTLEHNISLLAGLKEIGACGRPVVVGLSRKSFLGKLTGREADGRQAGSLAAMVFCILHGADIVRVHDVKESFDAVRIVAALKGGQKV